MYLVRAIQAFVMYCVNGESGSSLLIESVDSMIYIYIISLCNDYEDTNYIPFKVTIYYLWVYTNFSEF